MEMTYDVVVVGAGAAGLSAAVALGRSRRSVLVLDGGPPRNAPADGAHMLIGREGVDPLELVAAGRREAEGYGVEVVEDRAAGVRRLEADPLAATGPRAHFEVELAAGGPVRSRRLLLATGLVDELPDVPGLAEQWGHDVLHCPFCHGWEVRDRPIGVLASGPMAVHQVLMFSRLSDDVTLFLHELGGDVLDEQAWERLAALGTRVVEGRVARVVSHDGRLRSVELDDGHRFDLDALVVGPRFVARSELYEQLGGRVAENPMGRHVPAGPMGATELAGVWVAGNLADLAAGVALSAGMGVAAGGAVHGDLVLEDTDAAVARRRAA